MLRALLTGLLLVALSAFPASAGTKVGSVARVMGTCTGALDGTTRTLAAGDDVFRDETIVTAAGARATIALDDGTTLTIGENASLVVDAFVYDPSKSLTLHANVVGAFRFVSGALAPVAKRIASVTTPVATIGVRGTDFWGGPIDEVYGIALFEGAISVTVGDTVTNLEVPGTGVNLAAGATPGVTVWPEEKIARALATVTFP